MGALLGAMITGLIAISVFYFQNAKEEKSKKEHYKKIYDEIRKNLSLVKQSSDIFKKCIVNHEFNEDEMSVCKVAFNLVSKQLYKIEVKDIPYEIHSNFINLKDSLETIKLCCDIYMDIKELSFLEEELLADIERYKENLKHIEYYYQ